MPNIKSAKKRVKVTQAKTLQNKMVKSALKTVIKSAEIALEQNTENKAELVNTAIKKIDMAVTKGILHKNCAARKKSSLARKLNASA
ncbi:30S ribosomal protein S20 [Neobittarella massiliensis]|uniref:Small ribosomal subunit protein bS20 n=2 Tax=Oscillospiraceae TaxID=216572 RepID=A0A8J6ING1_9FIRM|nr:30S ribosomal protein S20 [Neobittarella massiliensis]MBC3516819.1 30S ribosomal protein S20 [Neobittarella massiliensis]SCJ80286.1 30S ribosomal protein S20 [uncultured Anaerotruncus sp.]